MEYDGFYCTCDHDVIHKDHKLWVKPPRSEKKHTPQQPRLYCKKCGRLKYTGSAFAREMGYYVNLLNEVKRKMDLLYRRKIIKRRMTKTQVQTIIRDLMNDDDFRDNFSNQSFSQYDLFKSTVKKYTNIDDCIIDSIKDKYV